jgi:hypothetical protein
MRIVIGTQVHRFRKGTVTQLMKASLVVSKFRYGRKSGRLNCIMDAAEIVLETDTLPVTG